MGALSNLTTGVNARLTTGLLALANPNAAAAPQTKDIAVLTEDTNDLATKIAKAIDQLGMLVLIGEPHYDNSTPTAPQSGLKVTFAIAIGETPIIWRDAAGLKPNCKDVAEYVHRLLAQLPVTGFLPLRVVRNDFVPDKKRNLRELTIEAITTLQPIP